VLYFVYLGLYGYAIISLNNITQLIFIMVKCDVLFEVRTEFLNIIYMSYSKLLLHASHAALPILNSWKLSPVVDAADLFSKLSIKQTKQSEIQTSAVCLKPPPITITSWLSHYSYQKDERA
jgi:hypothetical protein